MIEGAVIGAIVLICACVVVVMRRKGRSRG